jgi:hypothetical protein
MLSVADAKFLALQREQRAQAQISSDFSEILSESDFSENDDDLQLQIKEDEVFDTGLAPLQEQDQIQDEVSPIVVETQQKQALALELLKSASKQIEVALALLDDKKLHRKVETISQTLAPITEEPTSAHVAVETFASKAAKSAAPKASKMLATKTGTVVAPKAAEPIAAKAAQVVAAKAAEPIVAKAEEPIVAKAAQVVAAKAAEPIVAKAAQVVAAKAAEPIVAKSAEVVAAKAAEPIVAKAAKIVAAKAAEPIVAKAAQVVAAKAAEPIVAKAAEVVAAKAAEPIVAKAAKIVAPKAAEPIVAKAAEVVKDKQEFQVVLPKKSKNKGATIVVSTSVEHKDDFPSLGSSFSPVQKTGFWGSGKSSLQIAKSVAQMPSPPPTRSSPLNTSNKSMRASAGSRGPIDEESDYSDEEFRVRKHGGDDDKDGHDYWQ